MNTKSLKRNFMLRSAAFLIAAVLILPPTLVGQSSGAQASQGPVKPGGMATGGVHAPMTDALSRPITAGGFVDGAPVIFSGITKQAGLGKFHHRSGSAEKPTILESPGSGVALLDYDNDDWLDIYLLNGSTIPALKGKEPAPHA